MGRTIARLVSLYHLSIESLIIKIKTVIFKNVGKTKRRKELGGEDGVALHYVYVQLFVHLYFCLKLAI